MFSKTVSSSVVGELQTWTGSKSEALQRLCEAAVAMPDLYPNFAAANAENVTVPPIWNESSPTRSFVMCPMARKSNALWLWLWLLLFVSMLIFLV